MALALVRENSASLYSVECAIVVQDEIGSLWELCSRFIDPAFDLTPQIDNEDALYLCMNGEAQLWAIWSTDLNNVDLTRGRFLGAAVTEMNVHRNGYKLLTFLAMGGDKVMEWGRDFLDIVEAFAVGEGCHAVEMKGRKGWGHVFKDYPPTSWTYTKELPR